MSAPTKKQLAARHIRRLKTMRESVLQMAEQWEDLDQYCVNELGGLADSIETVALALKDDESVEAP
ncbi:hypothetical protein [Acidovorax sp. SUPP2825]|uniref:hypothetical protein n=1 Tax=Acidovorax sp. SUPP2825 TaxID=2920879 RepID=UPI0023DE6965|nr:hypothetical protein [Acidovorax sp. SUPP2825]GKS97017.1 hypothetical protein AVAK2825_20800 [Acidovorax sp. SUPP2825]